MTGSRAQSKAFDRKSSCDGYEMTSRYTSWVVCQVYTTASLTENHSVCCVWRVQCFFTLKTPFVDFEKE